MSSIGPVELIIFVVFLVSPLLSIGAVIDALMKPDTRWATTDQNKTAWVVVLAVSIFLGPFGLAIAIVYFASIRPKLKQA